MAWRVIALRTVGSEQSNDVDTHTCRGIPGDAPVTGLSTVLPGTAAAGLCRPDGPRRADSSHHHRSPGLGDPNTRHPPGYPADAPVGGALFRPAPQDTRPHLRGATLRSAGGRRPPPDSLS